MKCECDEGCTEQCGEASLVIMRDGRKMNVCCNCTLPGDVRLEDECVEGQEQETEAEK